MNHFERAELKKLSSLKLYNPNKFNATTAAIAFLVVILGLNLLSALVLPILQVVIESGWGIVAALCLSAIISQIFIFLVAFIFCKIKNVSLFGGGELNLRFNILPCIPALLLSIGFMLLIAPLQMYFIERIGEAQEFFFGSSILDLTVEVKLADFLFAFLYLFILAPILPAIAEEALFRGVIMSGLREFGDFFAIMLSGLLFALMHGNYSQLILQFVLGCEIAFVVIINENYFVGIIMHLMNNLIVAVISFTNALLFEVSPAMWSLIEGLSILIGLIMVCVAVCYYYSLIKFKRANQPSKSFLFYRPDTKGHPCCLVHSAHVKNKRFFVDKSVVLQNNNAEYLFFSGKRFHKFTKRSNNAVFIITMAIGIITAIWVVILSFFQ